MEQLTKEKQSCDLEWLRGAAQSRAFGPTTRSLLTPYIELIESQAARIETIRADRDLAIKRIAELEKAISQRKP